MKKERLFSLDVLRGLDMFYLAAVTVVLGPLFEALGMPEAKKFFCTHQWEGFTVYDLIMPLFMFMSGAAVPFAMKSRMDENGRPTAAFHKRVWSRFVMLWVLGMLVQGGLATFSLHHISFYSNTLQCIAIGYVSASYMLLCRSWKVRVAVPVVLVVAYGLIVHLGGDYTKDGNITMKAELAILNFLMPADNSEIELVRKYGYTWYLPTMMCPVIGLAGAYASEILRKESWGEWKRMLTLAAIGVGAWAIGMALELAGVKCVKHFFSVSFTLQAVGVSMMMLAGLYAVCDIWKMRKGTGLLMLYGQFALTAYLCESLFNEVTSAASKRLFGGIAELVPKGWGEVVLGLGFAIIVTAVLYIWRGYKVSEKAR